MGIEKTWAATVSAKKPVVFEPEDGTVLELRSCSLAPGASAMYLRLQTPTADAPVAVARPTPTAPFCRLQARSDAKTTITCTGQGQLYLSGVVMRRRPGKRSAGPVEVAAGSTEAPATKRQKAEAATKPATKPATPAKAAAAAVEKSAAAPAPVPEKKAAAPAPAAPAESKAAALEPAADKKAAEPAEERTAAKKAAAPAEEKAAKPAEKAAEPAEKAAEPAEKKAAEKKAAEPAEPAAELAAEKKAAPPKKTPEEVKAEKSLKNQSKKEKKKVSKAAAALAKEAEAKPEGQKESVAELRKRAAEAVARASAKARAEAKAKEPELEAAAAKKSAAATPFARCVLGSGLQYQVLKMGTGAGAELGKPVTVKYAGHLQSGARFDKGVITFRLGLGEVIAGWDEGVKGMLQGEQRRLLVPPRLAYGAAGAPPAIPPNATLIFEVERTK